MLIFNVVDEREGKKKKRGLWGRKRVYESEIGIKRESVSINGKTVIVLNIPRNMLKSEDVLTLLKAYKGKVLKSKNNADADFLNEYLFNPKPYYQRASLSSFVNQIKVINKEWKSICIKICEFMPFRELFDVVRFSKSVTLITDENVLTYKFINECFYKYGAVVTVKSETTSSEYDVYLDLDEIDDGGKLMIKVKDKNCLLYPDSSYFQDDGEYLNVLPYNIEHNIVCAAFSDK